MSWRHCDELARARCVVPAIPRYDDCHSSFSPPPRLPRIVDNDCLIGWRCRICGGIILHRTGKLWDRQAAHWQHLTAPGRPCAHDLAFNEGVARDWAARHGAPRVLVLGVTPEMAGMAWPANTDLLAVDRCPTMIRNVWPGFPRRGAGALCSDWLSMPLPSESQDLVFGDGCFGMLRYPDLHRQLVVAVKRVMQGNGLFSTRVFLRPDVAEAPAAVIHDLLAGRIANFQTFKFRLAMALHLDTRRGVRVRDVWDYWQTNAPSPQDLATRLGWPLEQIATIEAYRDQDATYYFPTLREMQGVLEEGFAEVHSWFPPYELGERCPTFVCGRKTAEPSLALAAA